MALSISSSLVQHPGNSLCCPNQSYFLRSSPQCPKMTPSALRKFELERKCASSLERVGYDFHYKDCFTPAPNVEFIRFSKIYKVNKFVIRAASSAAGSSSSNSDFNPYEILGVSPIAGFDKIKEVYARKKKDAESIGDVATANQLESAYDKIMMAQLMKRKKGETFGSFKVSKDIKYADKQPIVPWGPRFTKSDDKDIKINMAISTFFTAWIFIQRNSEWKPLQFLGFIFVYRIFEKLKSFEPHVSPTYNEYGEDEGKMLRMGKRLLRSLALVFGCMTIASLGYTGILNLIESTGGYIPRFLYNNQEMLVTVATAVGLYILASFYR